MSEVIFINKVKLQRAQEIVGLINGTVIARDEGQVETKNKFTAILESLDIDSKSEEAISVVYEKLGGLVLTHEEVEKRKKKAATKKPVAKKPAKKNDDEDEDDSEEDEDEE